MFWFDNIRTTNSRARVTLWCNTKQTPKPVPFSIDMENNLRPYSSRAVSFVLRQSDFHRLKPAYSTLSETLGNSSEILTIVNCFFKKADWFDGNHEHTQLKENITICVYMHTKYIKYFAPWEAALFIFFQKILTKFVKCLI